ncbi:MAG: hypothetical protein AAF688_12595 [Bacteroidota bacterium]
MIKFLFIALMFCPAFWIYGQKKQEVSSNPIIYGDFLIAGANVGNEVNGVTFGLTINYQSNKDLFSFRTTYIAEKNDDVGLGAILLVPLLIGGDSFNEFGLLYGKRFIFDESSFSVSAGISTNLMKFSSTVDGMVTKLRESYIAFPFELNFRLFKATKKRFSLLYGLIPIGEPTGFGGSFGIKFFGSLGTFNYVGIGLNFGFGFHKKY